MSRPRPLPSDGSPERSPPRPPPRWVFLDRDGTINVKPSPGEYVEQSSQLRLLPGAAHAIARLNRAGVWTGVVTNQRGVALGRMSLAALEAVHERLRELLAQDDAHLDAIYACPHGLDACDCRKPKPGMLLAAQRDHPGLDFAATAIVGDSLSDVETGRRVGLRTVLLGEQRGGETPDHRVPDLLAAVDWLLQPSSP